METLMAIIDVFIAVFVLTPFAFIVCIFVAALIAWWSIFVFRFVRFVIDGLKDFIESWTNPFSEK